MVADGKPVESQLRWKRQPKASRRGTLRVWLKRNWLLLLLLGLALAGIVLSILLLFEPCKKKSRTLIETVNVTTNVSTTTNSVEVFNRTVNVSTVTNVTLLQNVTRNSSTVSNVTVLQNATVNETRLYNVTVSYNETTNTTVFENVTTLRNVTIFENVTVLRNVSFLVNATFNFSVQLDVDAVSMLDTSGSMMTGAERRAISAGTLEHSADFAAGLSAMRAVFGALDSALQNSTLRVASGKWGHTTTLVNELRERNPAEIAELTMTQDAEWTFYAHALVGCLDELAARGANNSFQVCQVITDGALLDDALVYDGVYGPTSINSNWAAEPWTVTSDWDDGVWEACVFHGVEDCSVWGLSAHLQEPAPGRDSGVLIQNVLVGDFASSPIAVTEMYALSSCAGAGFDLSPGQREACPWTIELDTFDELVSAAVEIATTLASAVATRQRATAPPQRGNRTAAKRTDAASGAHGLSEERRPRRAERRRLRRYEQTTTELRRATESVATTAEREVTVREVNVREVTTTESKFVTESRIEAVVTVVTVLVLRLVYSVVTVAETVVALVTTQERRVQLVSETVALNVSVTATDEVSSLQTSVSKKDYCTGNGFSFVFLLLVVPLLVYLLFKPLTNALERACCPASEAEDDDGAVDFQVNPAFGHAASDTDAAAFSAAADRGRGAVSNTLHKPRAAAKKKTNFDGADEAPVSPEEERPPSPGARRRASSVARHSAVFARQPDAQGTEWGNGLAQVYDGDDWQEKAFDAFYAAVTCQKCRKKPAEPNVDF